VTKRSRKRNVLEWENNPRMCHQRRGSIRAEKKRTFERVREAHNERLNHMGEAEFKDVGKR